MWYISWIKNLRLRPKLGVGILEKKPRVSSKMKMLLTRLFFFKKHHFPEKKTLLKHLKIVNFEGPSCEALYYRRSLITHLLSSLRHLFIFHRMTSASILHLLSSTVDLLASLLNSDKQTVLNHMHGIYCAWVVNYWQYLVATFFAGVRHTYTPSKRCFWFSQMVYHAKALKTIDVLG